MFNKKPNSFLFAATIIGAATSYLTKDSVRGEDRDYIVDSYSSLKSILYDRNEL